MTLAHGAGAARYDELVVVAVLLVVLLLAVLQVRWTAGQRARQEDGCVDGVGPAEDARRDGDDAV